MCYFRDGEILIKELDQSHINVYAAFWLYDSEADRWRLMIASKNSDFASPKKAYIQINDVLESMKSRGITVNFSLENITVVSPIDPLITGLKKAVTTVPEDSSGFVFFIKSSVRHDPVAEKKLLSNKQYH
jgi:hypothetical protein